MQPASEIGVFIIGTLGDLLGVSGGVGSRVCGKSVSSASTVVPSEPLKVASLKAISLTTLGRDLFKSSKHKGLGP